MAAELNIFWCQDSNLNVSEAIPPPSRWPSLTAVLFRRVFLFSPHQNFTLTRFVPCVKHFTTSAIGSMAVSLSVWRWWHWLIGRRRRKSQKSRCQTLLSMRYGRHAKAKASDGLKPICWVTDGYLTIIQSTIAVLDALDELIVNPDTPFEDHQNSSLALPLRTTL